MARIFTEEWLLERERRMGMHRPTPTEKAEIAAEWNGNIEQVTIKGGAVVRKATDAHTRTRECDTPPPSTSGSQAVSKSLDTSVANAETEDGLSVPNPAGSKRRVASGPLTLPWPPTGNTAVRHAKGVHYLRKEVIAYRNVVADLCLPFQCHPGQFILHIQLSPPDRRKRDADNAIKSVLDALKGRLFEDDSMSLMRELHVTVDGYRGEVDVWIEPIIREAA